MSALRELFAKFDVDFDTSKLTSGAAMVEGLWGRVKQLGSELKGAALLGGLAAFTARAVDATRETVRTASTVGMLVGEFQRWKYVANLSDVSAETFTHSLMVLQRNLFAASEGSKEALKSFTDLGFSQQELKNTDVSTVIERAAEKFAALQSPIEKVALAQKVFGRSGTQLMPLLEGGAEKIRELSSEFQAFGGPTSKSYLDATEKVEDSMKRIHFGVNKLINGAMYPLILVWGWVAEKGAGVVKTIAAMVKGTNLLTSLVSILAVVGAAAALKILIAFAPIIAPFALLAAKLILIAAIFDDIVTFLQGGDSALGDFLDRTFGLGTSEKVLKSIQEAWEKVSAAVKEAWDALGGGPGILHTIGNAIDSVVEGLSRAIQATIEWGRVLGRALTGDFSGAAKAYQERADRLARRDKAELAQANDELAIRSGWGAGPTREELGAPKLVQEEERDFQRRKTAEREQFLNRGVQGPSREVLGAPSAPTPEEHLRGMFNSLATGKGIAQYAETVGPSAADLGAPVRVDLSNPNTRLSPALPLPSAPAQSVPIIMPSVAPPPVVAPQTTHHISVQSSAQVTVAADAKADSELKRVVKSAAQEVLDENNQKIHSALFGN
jgi:hypothetical protein